MENSHQRFAKDVFIYAFATIFVWLGGIFLMPIITKTLGAHDYGIWAQIQVTINIATVLATLGLAVAMTRFLPVKTKKDEIKEEFFSVFCVVILTGLIIAVIVFICSDFMADAFFAGATDIVRITGIIVLAWSLNSVSLAYFRAFRQIKKYSLFMIANSYGQIGIITFLVLNGYGILSLALAVLSVNLLLLIIMFFIIRAQMELKDLIFSE